MLERAEVKEILDKFGKYLVTQSRANLTRAGRRHTDALYTSLDYEANAFENSLQFDFGTDNKETSKYLDFIDKGVRGAGGVRKTTSTFNNRNNKGKLWKINAKDSPYRFTNKMPPIGALQNWAKDKGLSAFAVQRAVYHQGIKPTYFYSKPYEKAFETLPEELVEAYALDLERFMEITLIEKRDANL